MRLDYVRRYRMEFDFALARLPRPLLPADYAWVPWQGQLVERHAAVKFASFHSEIDAQVFPSLGTAGSCRRLMREISEHESFLPAATWMICYRGDGLLACPADCATIQGLKKPHAVGSIQNVGVTPEHRGLGLGRALVLQSLHGFRRACMQRVFLEVTADNEPAVELYRSVGFRLCRTMYQEVAFDAQPQFALRYAPLRERRYRRLAGCY